MLKFWFKNFRKFFLFFLFKRERERELFLNLLYAQAAGAHERRTKNSYFFFSKLGCTNAEIRHDNGDSP